MVMLVGADPSPAHLVLDSVGKGKEVIPHRRILAIFDQREVKMFLMLFTHSNGAIPRMLICLCFI